MFILKIWRYHRISTTKAIVLNLRRTSCCNRGKKNGKIETQNRTFAKDSQTTVQSKLINCLFVSYLHNAIYTTNDAYLSLTYSEEFNIHCATRCEYTLRVNFASYELILFRKKSQNCKWTLTVIAHQRKTIERESFIRVVISSLTILRYLRISYVSSTWKM